MPNVCAICVSPHAKTIPVLAGAGRDAVSIASEFGFSARQVRSHVKHGARVGVVVNVSTSKPPKAASAPAQATQSAAETPADVFRAAFHLDPMEWQEQYLAEEDPLVLLKGRQIGATQSAAALAIAVARAKAGADAVIISPSQRQSQEITVRARLGLWDLGEKLRQDTAGLLRLENGSRIISLPGTARGVRGYAPMLCVVDEAAWVSDDTWAAVRPLVAASKGRLVVQSTPGDPVGWFHALATDTPEGWARMVVRSSDVPTIDPAFLAREKREMAPHLYAQEYEATFAEAEAPGSLLWSEDDWMRLVRKEAT